MGAILRSVSVEEEIVSTINLMATIHKTTLEANVSYNTRPTLHLIFMTNRYT